VHRLTKGVAVVGLALLIAMMAAVGCARSGGSGSSGTVSTEEPMPSGEKKVFKKDQTDIKVVAGETFAIRLPQNASIGDSWRIVSAPDDSFVKESGSSMKYDSTEPAAGEGGQVEFKFKAKKPGTTTVTLYNCFRCSAQATAVATENNKLAERLTFNITVS